MLLNEILATPGLMERLAAVLAARGRKGARHELGNFYLICFLVGLALSLVSFFGQSFHCHRARSAPGRAYGWGPRGAWSACQSRARNRARATISLAAEPYDVHSVPRMVWRDRLLVRAYSPLWLWCDSCALDLIGLGGAWLVLLMLRKLLAHEHSLNPADYYMVGVSAT